MEWWENYRRFRDGFEAAMDPRLYNIEYLDALYCTGQANLLCTEKSAIMFGLKHYPTGARDVHFIVATGDLDELIELAPRVEAWGREHGCIGSLIESRAGWAKAMRKHGYEPHQVAVRKGL